MTDTNLLKRAEALCAEAKEEYLPTKWSWDGEIPYGAKCVRIAVLDCAVPLHEAAQTLIPELVSLVRKYQAALQYLVTNPSGCGCDGIAKAALSQGEGEAK